MEAIIGAVEQIQSTVSRADPQQPLRIFKNSRDEIIADACAILWIKLINSKLVAVKLIQALRCGAKPHETVTVLSYDTDCAFGQPIIHGKQTKRQVIVIGRQTGAEKDNKKNDIRISDQFSSPKNIKH